MILLELLDKYLFIISQALSLFLLIISLLRKSYLFSIPLIIICLSIFYFHFYIRQRPFYSIYKKHSLIIKDSSGKLAHFKSKWIFKPNYPYISRVRSTVFSDGSIENFSGTICNDISVDCTINVFSSDQKSLIVEEDFSGYLKKHKKYTSVLEFDFIDSYTKNQEYHIFRIESYQKKFSFSIIFPRGRYPTSIECTHTKSRNKIPIMQNGLKPSEFIDASGYKEYNWQVMHAPVGDSYRVHWTW